jgi:hypothetical protein
MGDKEKYLQWFCGFYEGEGSVSNDKSNNNRLRVSISQNDKTPLELGKSIWGGFIRNRIRLSPTGKICHGHDWVLNHKQAVQFLNDIKPYMIIPYKKNQVEKAFEICDKGLDRRFKCTTCEADFASPSGRRRHIKTFHENTDASS